MDGVDRVIRRRKSLTERLGLKGIGCCGSTWGLMPTTTFHVVDDENDDVVEVLSHHIFTSPDTPSTMTACLAARGEGSSRMNLAAALAAERHFGVDHDNNEVGLRPSPNSHLSPSRPNETGPRNDIPTYSGSTLDSDSHSSPLRPNERRFNSEVNIHSSSRSGSLRLDESISRNVVETPTRMLLMRLLEETERDPRNDVPTHPGSSLNSDSHSSPLLNSGVNIHLSSSSRPSSSRSDEGIPRNAVETPTRMSLMRLLEETEIYEGELLMEDECLGSDSVCCVCMRRKKGAAFIPCGHTFCRVCSRELWVNRGCCPLCNRSILEILDIY